MEPRSRSVLDVPPLRRTASIAAAMTWDRPREVELQQLRLLRRDRIVGADRAALDHLGIDPAIGVAEPALQRLRDGEVALRRYPDRH